MRPLRPVVLAVGITGSLIGSAVDAVQTYACAAVDGMQTCVATLMQPGSTCACCHPRTTDGFPQCVHDLLDMFLLHPHCTHAHGDFLIENMLQCCCNQMDMFSFFLQTCAWEIVAVLLVSLQPQLTTINHNRHLHHHPTCCLHAHPSFPFRCAPSPTTLPPTAPSSPSPSTPPPYHSHHESSAPSPPFH